MRSIAPPFAQRRLEQANPALIVPALTPLLRVPDRRVLAALVLGNLRYGPASVVLVNALESAHGDPRLAIVRALGKCGNRQCLGVLSKLVRPWSHESPAIGHTG